MATHLTANANLLGHVNLQQEMVSPAAKDTISIEFNSIPLHQLIQSPFTMAIASHSESLSASILANRHSELSEIDAQCPQTLPRYPSASNSNRTRKHSPMRNVRFPPRFNSCRHSPPDNALHLARRFRSHRIQPRRRDNCDRRYYIRPVELPLSLPALQRLFFQISRINESMAMPRHRVLHAYHCES